MENLREPLPRFKDAISSFKAPIISLIILMIGHGFFLTYISVRLELMHCSATEIGLTHSFFYFGILLGAIKIESLIIRIGHIRTYATFSSIFTVFILLQAFYVNPYYWMALRFFAGVSLAGLYIVIESWLLANCPSSTRGKVLSIYMIALYLPQSLSQFIIDLVDLSSFTPYSIAAVFCAFSSIPLTFTYTKTPSIQEPSHSSLRKLLFKSPFGFAGCFTSGLLISSIDSLFPNFAIEMGLPVALFLSVTIAGGFLLQWPIGHLSDIFNRSTVLLTTSILCIFPPIILSIWYSVEWILFPFSFFFGGLAFVLYPISISHLCDRVQPKEITQATGAMLVAYGLGSVLGPLYSSLFMDYLSSKALFYSLAIAATVLSIVGIISLSVKKKILHEDQSDYVSLPRTTPVAYELDPRANVENDNQKET